MRKFYVWTDGGARGNPGPAGYGVVIKDEAGKNLAEIAEYLGETTNNQAEYWGLVTALERVRELSGGQPVEVDVKMDSELIVKQMLGLYRIKNEGLKPLYWRIRDLIITLGGRVTFTHIPRRENKEADALSNVAMDRGTRNK
ncbi:MAG: ribonuclease HI family protein [Patescibacteria group bacterium]